MASEDTTDGPSGVSTENHGRTRVVRLDRPSRLNAFDDQMLLELGRAVRTAEADDDVGAIVLTGAGRAFCAGADVKATWGTDSALLGLRRRLNPVILALIAVEKPVIAAMNGVTAGAGLAFAGAADTRICANSAVFVPATVKLGIVPDGGMTWFLPRLIGPGRAFTWLCGGEHIDAATALSWGLVDELVEPDDLLGRALQLAELFDAAPGASVALTKRLLGESHGRSLADQLEWEHRLQDEAHRHPFHDRSTADGAQPPFSTSAGPS